MLVAIVGTSGCGKNTIINEILKNNPKYLQMPSLTTRKMRDGESQGHPYMFVSEDEFWKEVESGRMLEHEEVHKGIHYGISRVILDDYLQKSPVVIKDVDVNGVMSAKKAGYDVVAIFIEVSDKQELLNRIIARGETPERAAVRISRFDYEMGHKKHMDHVVTNNTLDELPIAISKIDDIIKSELKKRKI